MTADVPASGDTSLHLLSVWNPSYADDAMDRHLEVLLAWAERRDRGEAKEDDVYVWWGKLRSPRREEALPHRDEVLTLEEQIRDGVDTHLYLTDHHSRALRTRRKSRYFPAVTADRPEILMPLAEGSADRIRSCFGVGAQVAIVAS